MKAKRRNFETEIFQDNQMVYLLAPHASALQTNTTKFKQDLIGPLFIDTALDKTHYRLKDATGLIGWHIPRELYQEGFSMHPFRYSQQI